MKLKGLLPILLIPCVTAHDIDRYTVINIQIGDDGKNSTDKDKITTTIHEEHPTDLIRNLTAKLDEYVKRFENLVDRIENVSAKLDTCEARLENISEPIIVSARPRDCAAVQNLGYTRTGVYTIYPKPGDKGFQVRCDMDTTTGGWTVIQRRVSASDFYKTWNEYKSGFGDVNENYWLGNDAIHMISSQDNYKLRVDLTSMDNETAYAEYSSFSVGDENSNYKLSFGDYSGNAGDSLRRHNNKMFSTKDRNNDPGNTNCAEVYIGAWWYTQCHDVNLNGDYGNKAYAKGPVWQLWKGDFDPLKETEMKIRPM